MLKYLAEKAGGALYPTNPVARINVDQWLFYGSSTFTPLAQQFGLFTRRFAEDVPPAKKHYAEMVRDCFGVMDKHLASNPYLAGDYSVADISCYPDTRIAGADLGLDPYPNLKRWHNAIGARPAVQRAWALMDKAAFSAASPERRIGSTTRRFRHASSSLAERAKPLRRQRGPDQALRRYRDRRQNS